MVVLQEDKGDWPKQHFAFTVDEASVETAARILKERGVVVSETVIHEWIPAKSVYFPDPDGNDLELCAPIVADLFKHQESAVT